MPTASFLPGLQQKKRSRQPTENIFNAYTINDMVLTREQSRLLSWCSDAPIRQDWCEPPVGHQARNDDKDCLTCEGYNPSKLNLTGENLKGAQLQNANLKGVTLTRAILEEANLTGADLTDAKLQGANLPGLQQKNDYETIRFF